MAEGSTIDGLAVMVVEDEYLIALNVEMTLIDGGADVVGPFPRVAEALHYLDTGGRPNAAVLDINVGDRLVFPVAERLKELNIPFLFATGYDNWTVPSAFAHVERLAKPTDANLLVHSLGRLVGRDGSRSGVA